MESWIDLHIRSYYPKGIWTEKESVAKQKNESELLTLRFISSWTQTKYRRKQYSCIITHWENKEELIWILSAWLAWPYSILKSYFLEYPSPFLVPASKGCEDKGEKSQQRNRKDKIHSSHFVGCLFLSSQVWKKPNIFSIILINTNTFFFFSLRKEYI